MKDNMRKMYNKLTFKVQKNSPEILIGVGIATTVAATVMACKATLKISDILEEVEQTQNNMDYALEHKPEEYTQKDYDKAPSSPYSVKQVKNIFFKKLTLESNRKAIKKSSFIGNKPKFSFSNVSLIKDEVTWMYRKNFQRSMISYKGKLPVHDYDFKAHVRVNNFKPSKKNRTYDLGDRDGDTIAKIHVPKNSRNGSGTIKLDLNLTFNDYFFKAKL